MRAWVRAHAFDAALIGVGLCIAITLRVSLLEFKSVDLVKLDRNGNRLWTRLIGTPADDGAFDVSLDAAGNAYVTGSTGGALAGTPGLGGSDACVAKFSPDGVRR